ncbi:hypothetical protein J6TS7_13670 [Paenibacillus dendritiformis]|nr:hypothetical protein J6TS7_13670 [Paenibacillus dendritiformis]
MSSVPSPILSIISLNDIMAFLGFIDNESHRKNRKSYASIEYFRELGTVRHHSTIYSVSQTKWQQEV